MAINMCKKSCSQCPGGMCRTVQVPEHCNTQQLPITKAGMHIWNCADLVSTEET